MSIKALSFLVSFLVLSTVVGGLHADPGMWPYNRLPYRLLLERYGFEPTEEWIDRLKYGSVRMDSGGSGSFASPYGLVATNHHVAESALEQISTPEKDYLKDGFVATSLEEEIPIPDYTISVLQGIDDVTEEIKAVVTQDMSPYEAMKARQRRIAEIEERIFKETGEKIEIVNLFNGRFYHLYRYKRYTDVRLAFAPETQAGFFGGDEANFEFPRHALDEALFRVYEDGKPIEVKHFIPWSDFGSQEGELLFISGHPGRTQRYLTSAELAYQRDVQVPLVIEILELRRAALKAYSQTSDEAARQAKSDIFGIENSLKVYRGMAEALKAPGIAEDRDAEEKKFVAAALEAGFDDVPAQYLRIHRGLENRRKLRKMSLLSSSIGVNSSLFGYAQSIVRFHEEMKLENLDRRSSYREANIDEFLMRLFAERPFYPDLEVAKLFDSLQWLVQNMDLSEPIVRKILGVEDGESGVVDKEHLQARAEELVKNSALGDPKERRKLIEGGEEALLQSDDPWIALLRELLPLFDQIDQMIINETGSVISEAHQRLFEVREEMGEELSPDATFTLRMTYGVVEPYLEKGIPLPAYTEMGEAFAQAESRQHKGDWKLPDSWHEAAEAGRINASTPFNFVSTHDTIGGNSGSPVINVHGQKVGILFDGNRHGVGTKAYIPDAPKSRSVSVDCRATLSALAGIYEARWFVHELVQQAAPYTKL